MIQVKIGNSVSLVTGLTISQLEAVKKVLSYQVETRRRVRVKRKIKVNGRLKVVDTWKFLTDRKYLIDKRGEFPTGLLYLLEEHLAKVGLAYDKVDTRVRPRLRQLALETLFVKKSVSPYPEQTDAALAAKNAGRGIIVAPTGTGKSLIAALIIDALQVPTLIVVPTLNLKRQLTDGLRDAFGADKVGPLVSGRKKYFITVENVDALDPKRPVPGFDAVLVDEFHHSGAETYRKLNKNAWDGIYFKFGMTATPFRSKNEERLLLESVLSKVIYQIPYQVAVDKGYIVPMEVYYVDLPKTEMEGREDNYHAVYSELVVKNDKRNKTIADMVRNLHAEGIPTLVLTKQIDHGLRLQEMLSLEGFFIPFAKGENDDNDQILDAFNRVAQSTLIGTMGVLGEGVDTKPAEYIILSGGGKSKNQFMQNLGRGFRRFNHPERGEKQSCKVILFRDTSHKWLLQHFSACCRHLKEEYGIKPTKLELG